MDREAFDYYLSDRSRRREPEPESHCGSAGGAPCGDLARIALRLESGRIASASVAAEGCGAVRAAISATAELVEGAPLAAAASLGAAEIEAELGGLDGPGRHGAELAADALHRALGAAALSGERLLGPPARGERVLVAISGGVDSAVAALLEARSGAEVWAVTLELWSDPATDGEASCCSPEAVRSARALAHELGVPHLTVDLRDRFRAGVVEPFLAGYATGSTPNPCVRCNGRVRIEPMTAIAERLGAVGLATGHYARLVDDGEGPLLRPAADPAKDQTYMLAALPAEVLARMRFPLGGLRKPEVRRIATDAGLSVAGRSESQDLCFLAGVGKRGFLERHGGLGERPGEIVDAAGSVLGHHHGHHNFTVGQRRGIGIGSSEPLYVLATEAASNRVTVGPREQLLTDEVAIAEPTLRRAAERVEGVKLRYRARPVGCRLELDGERGRIHLAEPLARPAPGQVAVLLAGDAIVGHGRICAPES
jgi:tRNA-uridine 2-sulfurtransferase